MPPALGLALGTLLLVAGLGLMHRATHQAGWL